MSAPATFSAVNPSRDPRRHPARGIGPLAGVRIADFCWVGVGACATRALADFGAEVIKIEDRKRLDLTRRLPVYKGEKARAFGQEDPRPDVNRGGVFNNYNRNKLSLTVDMRRPKGRALLDQLVAHSSVVTENFAPGVMERWGLTYERLQALCPSVIYGRMSGYGHSGPDAGYRSYGPIVQAVSGLSFISGLPNQPPSGWGLSYMDNQAAYFASAALMLAIYERNRSGRGSEIDVSAVEVGIKLLGPILLEVAANGRRTRAEGFPVGNRLEHPDVAPHGVYPLNAADRWVAIAVFDESDWAALKAAMGHPAWAERAEYADRAARRAQHDTLDRGIAAWTATLAPAGITERLQQQGVCAALVQNAEDTNEHDPQLAARGAFFELDHPVIGPARFEGTPLHFSRTRQINWRSGPLLGEDNRYVLTDILGLGDAEVDALQAEGVI